MRGWHKRRRRWHVHNESRSENRGLDPRSPVRGRLPRRRPSGPPLWDVETSGGERFGPARFNASLGLPAIAQLACCIGAWGYWTCSSFDSGRARRECQFARYELRVEHGADQFDEAVQLCRSAPAPVRNCRNASSRRPAASVRSAVRNRRRLPTRWPTNRAVPAVRPRSAKGFARSPVSATPAVVRRRLPPPAAAKGQPSPDGARPPAARRLPGRAPFVRRSGRRRSGCHSTLPDGGAELASRVSPQGGDHVRVAGSLSAGRSSHAAELCSAEYGQRRRRTATLVLLSQCRTSGCSAIAVNPAMNCPWLLRWGRFDQAAHRA